jgi:ATP-dependent helicase HepA
MTWRKGMKLVHRAQKAWGVGVVVETADEGRRLAVRFAGRPGVTVVSGRDPALQEMPPDTPLGAEAPGGPLDLLASGEAGPASAFRLRTRVQRLEALRRADSLGALLSSRVHVLPHQVGAAGRILADRLPRFVLADEVGLGKTIEAGLVFAGLRQLGIAERVLVAVPEHLAFQWLAELFHKFNALFTLLTPERVAELGGPEEALRKSPLAIVSHERLVADPALCAAAAALPADLMVVDEAHHLEENALFEAVRPAARSSFGLLLLTATPVRLDPREYYRLLSLVEPLPSTSLPSFLQRLEDHEAYAEVARSLLAGSRTDEAVARLRALAPGDPFFSRPARREQLLDHLALHYSLSARLVRNRRVKVGAFTRRVLRREDVPEGSKLPRAAALCGRLARAGEKVLVFGGDLARLRALQAAIAQRERLEALLYLDAPASPPPAGRQSRPAPDDATTLSMVERDRLVARFRDPEGPMLLLSGEAGGEGRNFQFACQLVCLDLPDSPLVLEQRIGRLDRLGQSRPVEIHVLPEPGEEAFLADLYQKEIGIFDEPVGGLDAVLASVPQELEALRRRRSERGRETFRADLARRVAEGRRAQHEGYDPLLDIRSASIPELVELVRGAFRRLGEEAPDVTADPARTQGDRGTEAIEHALQTLSRWLEEELEELTVETGRRAGIEVDTDENVHPFEAAFTLGARMEIEALPGMTVPEEEATHLGSFWRETAVARDELEWFATGHRLVEALLQLARDGDAGRAAVVRRPWAPRRGGLYLRWTIRWPSAADVAPGARVASRQASRYLEGAPLSVLVDLAHGHRVVPGGAAQLEVEVEEAEGASPGPAPAEVLVAARRAAEVEAEAMLGRRREAARKRLEAQVQAEAERLVSSRREGGAEREAVARAIESLGAWQAAVEASLAAVGLELDAVALLVR